MRLLVLPDARTRSWPQHVDAPEVKAVSLSDALRRAWPTDAHTAAYLAPDPPRRLCNNDAAGAAVWSLGVVPRMALLVVDVDHPATHEDNKRRKAAKLPGLPAPEEWRVAERAKVDALRAQHPGVIMYETRGGYRLVAELPDPVPIDSEAAKAAWRRWYVSQLAYLSRAYGIEGDPACADWTRLYRLPRATRGGGHPEEWPSVGDARAIGLWRRTVDEAADAAELVRLAGHDPRWGAYARLLVPPPPRARAARAPRSRPVDATVCPLIPPGPLAADLAVALGSLPRGTRARHDARLAVAAVLRQVGWTTQRIERLVVELAVALGKDARALVAETVPSTVKLVDHGGAFLGEPYLRAHAPEVWRVLADALGEQTTAARLAAALDARGVPDLVSRETAAGQLRAAYRDARDARWLLLLRVTAGAGKTFAAVADAADNAARGQRTALLAPSHAVAHEMLERLAERGVVGHHLVSIAAHKVDGAHTCHAHEPGQLLASGGVSVVPALCDGRGLGEAPRAQRSLPIVQHRDAHPDAPCPRRGECPAHAAAVAPIPSDALVVVGVHQHAERAHEWLRGTPGALLVVDEAPPLLDAARWSGAELLDAARRAETALARRDAWRGDLLRAAGMGLASSGEASSVRDVLRAGLVAQGMTADAAAEQVSAWASQSTTDNGPARPTPARRLLLRARRGADEKLRRGVDVLRAAGRLSAALVGEQGVVVSVATRTYGPDVGALELRVAAVVEPLRAALRDQSLGRVVLDATADPTLLVPYVGAVVDRSITVADPCKVRRTFIPWGHGTRRHTLLPGGGVRWSAIRAAFSEALAVALPDVPDGGTVALLSYRALVVALRRAWEHPETADPDAARLLAPLRARGIVPLWGHYGGLRGRNDWAAADAAVCIGTPYPTVAEQEQRAETMTAQVSARDLVCHEARAELEQAVARGLRGHRTKPLSLVVVAAELPRLADARWSVRALPVGRPVAADAAELVTLAERMGIAAAARAAGVSRSTVQRARRAERALPPPGGVSQCVAETEGAETPEEVSVAGFDTPPGGGGGSTAPPPPPPTAPPPTPPRAAPVPCSPRWGVVVRRDGPPDRITAAR